MRKRSQKTRVRIRRLGWMVVLITALTQLGAWMYGRNLLYIVVGAEASLLALSYVLAAWMVRGIGVSRHAPGAAHRGDPFLATIRIENRKSRMPAFFLSQTGTVTGNGDRAFIPKIPTGHAAILRISHVFERRGVYRLPAVEVASTFPFGLIEARRRFDDEAEIVVYPRVLPVRPEALTPCNAAGSRRRTQHADGDEFFSLRDYAPGDDARHVAWRASARRRSLLVKETSSDRSRFVTIAVDTCRCEAIPQFDDRFEETVELAASLAVFLLRREYSVAVVTPSTRLPMDEGQRHMVKALDMLARIQPLHSCSDGRLARRGRRLRTDQTTCVCVSPDPRTWGTTCASNGGRVLNPREVLLA